MIRRIRQRFWLLMMDAASVLPSRLGGGAFGSAWTYALERASDATDWGDGADCSDGNGEEPF